MDSEQCYSCGGKGFNRETTIDMRLIDHLDIDVPYKDYPCGKCDGSGILSGVLLAVSKARGYGMPPKKLIRFDI